MSEELFPEAHSAPPRLTVARQRAEKAEKAYADARAADGSLDGFSQIPKEIRDEAAAARAELSAAEAEEMKRSSR